MITRVEIINDPIAYGAALKTKSKFFRTVSPANKNIKMILKSFQDKNKLPEIRFKIPKIYVNTSNNMSDAKRKNKPDTKVTKIPDSKAAALKQFSPRILLTV